MLNDTELPVEFWYKAARAQVYVRARMQKGPIVVEDIVDETTTELTSMNVPDPEYTILF
jgi:hypothetical protein